MAKKFVRGVTGVEDIENFDKSLTNVNDLVSDGQHTYVHRKKGKSEEYHNLTNNLKTIISDNTDLLSVENDNNSTNSATLHPQHDTLKEQVIEPANNTITIVNGENATDEKTRIKVTDELVETINNKQDKLSVGDGLALENNRIIFKPTYAVSADISEGIYKSNVAGDAELYVIFSFNTSGSKYVQFAFRESIVTSGKIIGKFRFVTDNVPTQWYNILMDETTITNLINAKQNTITNNTSIGVSGSCLQQLYALKQTYTVTGGVLKTHVKSISENTNVNTTDEEFNFIVKLNKGVSSVNFTLNTHDTTKFSNIMSTYGSNNTVRISGCVFTLLGSTLTVSTANNTDQNYVITFSDII